MTDKIQTPDEHEQDPVPEEITEILQALPADEQRERELDIHLKNSDYPTPSPTLKATRIPHIDRDVLEDYDPLFFALAVSGHLQGIDVKGWWVVPLFSAELQNSVLLARTGDVHIDQSMIDALPDIGLELCRVVVELVDGTVVVGVEVQSASEQAGQV